MTALRWAVWLLACVGAGVVLGLVGLRSAAETAPPSERFGVLRDAAVPRAHRRTPYSDPRLGAPTTRPQRPRVAVVIDDLGLNGAAFSRVNALPPPLTLAFLPYGEGSQAMLDGVAPGHEAILHLPAEPLERTQDAGPDMMRPGSPQEIRAALEANLSKLSGYVGVNNHTGSLFTGDAEAMSVLLDALDARGLYFLDSLTTPTPVAMDLARDRGWRVLARDVFLDADYAAGEAGVRAQLMRAERIARVHGEAIVIGHPYRATLAALGPWLVTAQARGLELVPVSALIDAEEAGVLAGLR